MQPDYSPIPTSTLQAPAKLVLKRARLHLPCTTREHAISIIRGVRPAPPRKLPSTVKPCMVIPVPLCFVCHKPMPMGTLCDTLGRNHIECKRGDL